MGRRSRKMSAFSQIGLVTKLAKKEVEAVMVPSLLRAAVLVAVTAAAVIIIPRKVLQPALPVVMGGQVAPGFEKVAEVFRHLLETGEENGGAFAVYYQGAPVVDLWGGYADYHARQAWHNDTLSKWFSSTKAVAAVVCAVLVDRGYLDYDERVSYYWPEFSQNGKENITVQQLLAHRAGLAVIDEPFELIRMYKEPDVLGEFLARQPLNWVPDKTHGYHALTFGLFVNQLVRQSDPQNRGIQQFFREEIAEPYDIDFYIGLPMELNYRAARVEASTVLKRVLQLPWKYYKVALAFVLQPWSLPARITRQPYDIMVPPLERINQPHIRALDLASSQGYGTARAMAKLFGILGNGGHHNDNMLLNPELVETLNTPFSLGYDQIIMDESIFSVGMKLFRRFEGTPKERYIFGHPGIGGQMVYADPKERLGWGYVTNFFSITADGDYYNYLELERAMYACVAHLNNNIRPT